MHCTVVLVYPIYKIFLLLVHRLKEKSPSMLWNDDLDEFLEKLEEVEEKEKADAAEATDGKKAGKGKKKTFKQETMASPHGIRVAVKVSCSTKRKIIYCLQKSTFFLIYRNRQ